MAELSFSRKEIMVIDTFFVLAIIFHIAAVLVTEKALSTGMFFEANPLMAWLFNVSLASVLFLGLGMYVLLFVLSRKFILSNKDPYARLAYPAVASTIFLLSMYDFLHDVMFLLVW